MQAPSACADKWHHVAKVPIRQPGKPPRQRVIWTDRLTCVLFQMINEDKQGSTPHSNCVALNNKLARLGKVQQWSAPVSRMQNNAWQVVCWPYFTVDTTAGETLNPMFELRKY